MKKSVNAFLRVTQGNNMPNNFQERLREMIQERREARLEEHINGLEEIEQPRGDDMRVASAKETSPGTFGIEIEINNVQRLIKPLPVGWDYTNDISIQSNAPIFRGKPVDINDVRFTKAVQGSKVGIEIVSPIISDFKDVISIVDNIKETGVKTNAKDCGIHIHVSFPKGNAITSLFKLGLKYEPLFYAVGTFGGFSRGVYKDYIYQRPMAYPPISKIAKIKQEEDYEPYYYGYCYDINKFSEVMNEKDFSNFLATREMVKYHSAKYCGLNFYSYFYRSTIEVRTFNLTTNYSYLKAAINLSRDFALAGLKEYYSRSEGEVIQVNFINDMSKQDLQALLEEFLSRYSTFLDEEDAYTLRLLIRNAPKIDIKKKVLFHLIFHRNGDNSRILQFKDKKFLPEKLDISDAIKPKAENLGNYDFEGDLCAN